jgi:Bifunctional DNA primase/polymerase, N-terminal
MTLSTVIVADHRFEGQVGYEMTRILDAALELAATGKPVFPCSISKCPTAPRGFKDATTEPDEIRRLWRDHPGGLIGVATGAISGFDVLDIDAKHQEGHAWWCAHPLPCTRTHRTRSGGLHLLFQQNGLIRCSAGKIALGVDTRGNGGYVIWWPAYGCPVLSDAPIAPWPAWLLKEFAQKSRPRSCCRSLDRVPNNRLLVKLVQMVAGAREGERNSVTFWAACRAGEMVGAGVLGATTAIEIIMEAATRSGLPRGEAERTAKSGLKTTGGCSV